MRPSDGDMTSDMYMPLHQHQHQPVQVAHIGSGIKVWDAFSCSCMLRVLPVLADTLCQ